LSVDASRTSTYAEAKKEARKACERRREARGER